MESSRLRDLAAQAVVADADQLLLLQFPIDLVEQHTSDVPTVCRSYNVLSIDLKCPKRGNEGHAQELCSSRDGYLSL